MENREKLVCLDLKDQEVIGVQLGLLEIWVNQVLLVQEELRERLVTLGHLGNKEIPESQEEGDRGDQLVNLETLEPKAYQVWREGRDPLAPLDLLDPLGTPFQWPLPPCKERLCQECLELLDPWDPLVLLEREELTVREAQGEAEECLAWLDHLELLADRVCLAEQVTLESQERLADPGDPILRMTSERFAPLC